LNLHSVALSPPRRLNGPNAGEVLSSSGTGGDTQDTMKEVLLWHTSEVSLLANMNLESENTEQQIHLDHIPTK
jgi:hypothetical protein